MRASYLGWWCHDQGGSEKYSETSFLLRDDLSPMNSPQYTVLVTSTINPPLANLFRNSQLSSNTPSTAWPGADIQFVHLQDVAGKLQTMAEILGN